MPSIPITGIASSWRYPGSYGEIKFGQGPSTAAGGVREVIFVMPMTSAGTWTANTLYAVNNEQTVSDGAGAGSMCHRAIRAALAANKNAKYWCVPYAASSGGGVATATVAITFATSASAAGIATIWVCGEECSAGYKSGDTVTTIATAVRDAVNAKPWLPVTASIVAGVLTLTAKIAGASQGDGTTGVYQVHAETTTGTGTTVSPADAEVGGTVAGADGATTEATNFATALATLAAVRKYYIGTSMGTATPLGSLKTHLVTKSDPNPGLRSVGIFASTHTLAAMQTLATTLNYERIQGVWQLNGDDDPATIVGNMAACRQLEEELDCAASFDLYRAAGRWNVKPARLVTNWPTMADMNDAINDGITPIGSDASGSFIAMAVDTRSKNAAGTQDDFRAAEPHRVSVGDLYLDTILARDANTYANKKLQSDALLPDGKVDTNQKLPPNTITAFTYKTGFVYKQIDDFAPGRFQDVAAMKASVRCVRDPSNTGRLEVGHDIRVVDIRHQVTYAVAEVSPG